LTGGLPRFALANRHQAKGSRSPFIVFFTPFFAKKRRKNLQAQQAPDIAGRTLLLVYHGYQKNTRYTLYRLARTEGSASYIWYFFPIFGYIRNGEE
jgi:hypothetical protein